MEEGGGGQQCSVDTSVYQRQVGHILPCHFPNRLPKRDPGRVGSTGHPDGHLAYKRLGSFGCASNALVTLFRETHRRGPAVFKRVSKSIRHRAEERRFCILPVRAQQGDQGPQASTAPLLSKNAVTIPRARVSACCPRGHEDSEGTGSGGKRKLACTQWTLQVIPLEVAVNSLLYKQGQGLRGLQAALGSQARLARARARTLPTLMFLLFAQSQPSGRER